MDKTTTQETTAFPRWRGRLTEIDSDVEDIVFPSAGADVTQDEEWCNVVVAGENRHIRFHDYHEIYQIPGLYESLFYERLECCSPSRTVALLLDVLSDTDQSAAALRVLDLGAGNGMVGDELHSRDASPIVGIDIVPEAKQAAERDRDGVYDSYFVADLTDLTEEVEEKLRAQKLNCLTTVAALGFGDIPPEAFIKALDLIETPGWVAFTIKEDFLRERDTSGFSQLVRRLSRDEIIQTQAYRRFRHRVSMTGESLHYVAVVARKLHDVPDEFFQE